MTFHKADLNRRLELAKRQQVVINKELIDSELNLQEAEEYNYSCMEKSLNMGKVVRSLAAKLEWGKRKKQLKNKFYDR